MKGITSLSSAFVLLSLTPTLSAAAGYVDEASVAAISGWACDSSGNAQWVHVYEGATHIVSTTSNTVNRPDTSGICAGKTWTGFSVETPRLTSGNHTLDVYVNDSPTPSASGAKLPGASLVYSPSAQFIGPSPYGVIESATSERVSGWVCDTDGSTSVPIEIHIQHELRGPLTLLASGSAIQLRGDVSCGSVGARSFNLLLPTVAGGTHSVVVKARNQGAGSDRYLEEYAPYIRRVSFPFAPSLNWDPNVMRGASCWYQSPSTMDLSGCVGGMDPWIYKISSTIKTPNPEPEDNTPPAPQTGYFGNTARLRIDGLASGTVLKIQTYDPTPNMYPWDYNFQALQTNQQEVVLLGSSRPKLHVNLRIRPDWNSTDNQTGPEPGIDDLGTTPWVNLIVAAVFRDTTTGKNLFVETVPFVRGVFPAVGTSPPWVGVDKSGSRNARVPVADLPGAVSLPSQMLVGESRAFSVDLYSAFQASFAGQSYIPAWSNLVFTGAYVGTEQYGKHQFALDVTRLSVTQQ